MPLVQDLVSKCGVSLVSVAVRDLTPGQFGSFQFLITVDL